MIDFPFRFAFVDRLGRKERENQGKLHYFQILDDSRGYGSHQGLDIRLPKPLYFFRQEYEIRGIALTKDLSQDPETIALLNEHGYEVYSSFMKLGDNPPVFLEADGELWRRIETYVPSQQSDSPS